MMKNMLLCLIKHINRGEIKPHFCATQNPVFMQCHPAALLCEYSMEMHDVNDPIAVLDRKIATVHKQVAGITRKHILVEKSALHGEVHLTSTSLQFLKECKHQHPNAACQTVIDMLISHRQRFGDQGWLCAGLYANLKLAVRNLPYSRPDIIEGFRLMNDLCTHFLSLSECLYSYPVHWSDSDAIFAVMATVFTPHIGTHMQLSSDDIQRLLSQLLEAFIASLHAYGGSLVPNVLFHAVLHDSFVSTLHLNSIVLDVEIPRYFPVNGISSCRVAVFDASLEFPRLNTALVLPNSLANAETDVLTSVVRVCQISNINLLVTQKRIHPYLQLLLHRCGIVALPRTSIMHIGQLQRLCGAQLLGGMDFSIATSINESCIGFLQHLRIIETGYKRLLLATNDASCADIESALPTTYSEVRARVTPYASFLLQTRAEHCRIELQTICESVVKVLKSLLSENSVLIGGGCWQMCLVRQLRECIAKIEGRSLRFVCETFADTLENCVTRNGKLNAKSYTMTVGGREINSYCVSFDSPVAPGNALCKVVKSGDDSEHAKTIEYAHCLDLASACKNAINTAVDTCICAIDVDSIIIDKIS